MNNNAFMIRRFHAVGHGFFISERFLSKNGKDEIKVVFDCGGTNKEIIKSNIYNTFKDKDKTYALCVSHFDKNHIN